MAGLELTDIDQGRPLCSECGRPIAVGAATEGRWLCEYCLIIDGFDLTQWSERTP